MLWTCCCIRCVWWRHCGDKRTFLTVPLDDPAGSPAKLKIGGHLKKGRRLRVCSGYFGVLGDFPRVLRRSLLGGQVLL